MSIDNPFLGDDDDDEIIGSYEAGELPELPDLPEVDEVVPEVLPGEDELVVEDDGPEFLDDGIDSILQSIVAENDSGVGDDEDDEVIQDSFDYANSEEEEDPFRGFVLDEVLSDAIDAGASDVHISAEQEVRFTIRNDVIRQPQYVKPNGILTQRLQQASIKHVSEEIFVTTLELDTSYVIKNGRYRGRRFRLSIGRSFGEVFLTFRVINDVIPSASLLGIPAEMMAWTELSNGLVMINGPTGTGKSTTMASMIQHIKVSQRKKIISLERPIEYVFKDDGLGYVVQREIGVDARSFAAALTSALRQKPNVIVVGEVRDQEEVNELLRASETGHLAISTMHTNSAPATLNRIKSLFNGEEQLRILATMADISRGFANQVLLKTLDGKGQFAVREILQVDSDEVRDLIFKGDVQGLRKYQEEHAITMEDGLVEAVLQGRCSVKEARLNATFPSYFDQLWQAQD